MFKKMLLVMSLSVLSLHGMDRNETGKHSEAIPALQAGESLEFDRDGNWQITTYDSIEMPVEIVQGPQQQSQSPRNDNATMLAVLVAIDERLEAAIRKAEQLEQQIAVQDERIEKLKTELDSVSRIARGY